LVKDRLPLGLSGGVSWIERPDDQGSEALGQFAAAMVEYGDKPEQITAIVIMAMCPA
jgi:hypothetical protein